MATLLLHLTSTSKMTLALNRGPREHFILANRADVSWAESSGRVARRGTVAFRNDLVAFGGESSENVSGRLGVDGKRRRVGVVVCVTSLVVARDLGHTCAGVQAADGLVESGHERSVVTAASEYSRGDIDTLAGKVVDKQLLDDI